LRAGGPFAVQKGSICVLAIGHKDDFYSEQRRVDIDRKRDDTCKIDPTKSAKWKRAHDSKTTK